VPTTVLMAAQRIPHERAALVAQARASLQIPAMLPAVVCVTLSADADTIAHDVELYNPYDQQLYDPYDPYDREDAAAAEPDAAREDDTGRELADARSGWDPRAYTATLPNGSHLGLTPVNGSARREAQVSAIRRRLYDLGDITPAELEFLLEGPPCAPLPPRHSHPDLARVAFQSASRGRSPSRGPSRPPAGRPSSRGACPQRQRSPSSGGGGGPQRGPAAAAHLSRQPCRHAVGSQHRSLPAP
jgi:hypothetical protein